MAPILRSIMIYDMYYLLRPKCLFCDYNGPNFYQSGSHHKYCPFHDIAGVEARLDLIETFIRTAGKRMREGRKTMLLRSFIPLKVRDLGR